MLTKYYATNAEDGTEIKVKVGYNLGGINYWNGDIDKRGYYAYVQAVKREKSEWGTSESFMVGEGFKVFLKEVKRKSKKAEAEADALAEEKSDEWAERMAAQKELLWLRSRPVEVVA